MATGYEVNIRRATRDDELIAVIPTAYRSRHGERYYMAYTSDGWVELEPRYVTRYTRAYKGPVGEVGIYRAVCRAMGYLLTSVDRVYG